MERYIGLDPHGTSCTFGVIGPSGRKLRHDVVETNGKALVSYVRSIPGRKHLCLEEGTQSAWLYEILSPHVEEIVVAGLRESRGQKSLAALVPRGTTAGPSNATRFEIDVLECPSCKVSPMRILAAIHPPTTTRAILNSLGLPTRAPPVTPAQPVPQDWSLAEPSVNRYRATYRPAA